MPCVLLFVVVICIYNRLNSSRLKLIYKIITTHHFKSFISCLERNTSKCIHFTACDFKGTVKPVQLTEYAKQKRISIAVLALFALDFIQF